MKQLKENGITAAGLKWIAIIFMFIDHFGASVLTQYIIKNNLTDNNSVMGFYHIIRLVGRISFPIFIFLLIEGFCHTKNLKKYLLRLGLFALLSEIPFDLAFYQTIFSFQSQNVFFTLFIGLFTIFLFSHWESLSASLKPLAFTIGKISILFAGMGMAYLLQTDYSYAGVLAIFLMYQWRKKPCVSMAIGVTILTLFCSLTESFAFINLALIALYNGKRGKQSKYFFYLFYPLHLLFWWVITYFLL